MRWPDLFRGRDVILRVDPGFGAGHHAKVRTGGKEAKFGLSPESLTEFLKAARENQVRIVGLHADDAQFLRRGVRAVGRVLNGGPTPALRLAFDRVAGQPDQRLLPFAGRQFVQRRFGALRIGQRALLAVFQAAVFADCRKHFRQCAAIAMYA